MTLAMTWLARACDTLATVCFAGFFLAILAQVAYRYLGVSLVFSEELARLLNLYVVFVGLVLVTIRHGHIRIDILDRMFGPGRFTDTLYRVQLFAALIFLSAMTVGAWQLMIANWPYPLATMSFVSQGTIYLAPFLGGLFSATLTAFKLFSSGIDHAPAEF